MRRREGSQRLQRRLGWEEKDGEKRSRRKDRVRAGGREERACTAMQTPFGISRSAQSPAMRVLTVCLDQAVTDSLP